MKKLTEKLIAALLSAILLLSLLISCGGDIPEESESTASETTSEAAYVFDRPWTIVRPDEENDYEIKALQVVSRCLNSIYGKSIKSTTDFKKKDAPVVPAEYEILIGETNRTQSQEICASLSGSEGLYRIINSNVIVVAGGSPEATLAAAEKFVSDVFGYTEQLDSETNKYKTVTPASEPAANISLEGRVSIAFPKVLLNGILLEEYKLVTADTVKSASTLAKSIRSACGKTPEIITSEEYTEGPAIFLGYTPGYESGHCSNYLDAYSYYVTANGNTLAIDWKNSSVEKSVYASFAAEYLNITSKVKHEIKIAEGTHSLYTLYSEHNLLFKMSENSQNIASGVVYHEIKYKDRNNAPVIVRAITVEKGSASFYAGIPGDAMTESVTGNVLNTIKAVTANGKNVLAGTNAGFFDMNGTGLSRGMVIKEGVLLRESNGNPCFAQLKDGSVGIYTTGQYSTMMDKIRTAVTGNVILMQNGLCTGTGNGSEMAVTRHPRTAVGITGNGDVVIIEIDGRQSVSNGASYFDMVTVFRDFGCETAMNLDGGGSSTMVIRQSDGYKLMNSPSDGSMRSVQDALLVIAEY